MSSPFGKILHEIAEHRRMTANSDRVGYVHEVNKDKIRVVMGISPDGSPWLSPWLHTTNMRGGARERRLFVKGQNVRISAPGGDYRQATVTHWAESESFPAPAHADDNPSAETYQIGKLRHTHTDGTHEIWIADQDDAPPAHQDQTGQPETGSQTSGATGSNTQQSSQQTQTKATPALKLRIDKDGGITARIGKDVRMSATKDGAKIKHTDNCIFVTKDGCYSTKPIQILADPIKDDDT